MTDRQSSRRISCRGDHGADDAGARPPPSLLAGAASPPTCAGPRSSTAPSVCSSSGASTPRWPRSPRSPGSAKGTVYLYFAVQGRPPRRAAGPLPRAVRGRRRPSPRRRSTSRRPEPRCCSSRPVSSTGRRRTNALHHVLFHAAGVSEEDAFERGRTLMSELVRDGVESGRSSAPSIPISRRSSSSTACTASSWRRCTRRRPTGDASIGAVAELVPRTLGVALS